MVMTSVLIKPAQLGGSRLGLALAPAPTTISMRAAVGLSRSAGLLVRAVEPGTAAARAGLQPGDVLTSAASRELRFVAARYAALRDTDGHTIRLRPGTRSAGCCPPSRYGTGCRTQTGPAPGPRTAGRCRSCWNTIPAVRISPGWPASSTETRSWPRY